MNTNRPASSGRIADDRIVELDARHAGHPVVAQDRGRGVAPDDRERLARRSPRGPARSRPVGGLRRGRPGSTARRRGRGSRAAVRRVVGIAAPGRRGASVTRPQRSSSGQLPRRRRRDRPSADRQLDHERRAAHPGPGSWRSVPPWAATIPNETDSPRPVPAPGALGREERHEEPIDDGSRGDARPVVGDLDPDGSVPPSRSTGGRAGSRSDPAGPASRIAWAALTVRLTRTCWSWRAVDRQQRQVVRDVDVDRRSGSGASR